MANVIQQAISSIRNKASEMFNDNKGMFRQGNFTPLQAIGDQINYQKQSSPVNNTIYTGIETAGRPIVNSLANIGALGATGLGSAQMAFNRPESALNSFNLANSLRNFAGTQGSFDQGTGWNTIKKGGMDAIQTALTGKGLKYMTPGNIALTGAIGGGVNKLSGGSFSEGAGKSIGNLPALMGAVGLTNPILNRFMPASASGIAGRAAGSLGNVAQGLGINAMQGTAPSLQGVGVDALMGFVGGKGQFDVPNVKGMTNTIDAKEKDFVNNVLQRIRLGITTADHETAVKEFKTMAKTYGLDSYPGWKKLELGEQAKLLSDRMDEMASQWAGLKMGITDQSKRLKIKPTQLDNLQTGVVKPTDLQTNVPPIVKQSINQIDQTKNKLNLEVVPPSDGSIPRGFTQSVQDAPDIAGQTKAAVSGTYIPKPNEKLMGEARALLESGATIDFKNTQGLDKKVAATIQEAINQQNAGNHEAAANLFNNLSEHGTELGRSVQAFNLLQKMSPEAIALSAAGKIKKYNLANPRRPIPELTGDQVKMIADKVQEVDLLKGREKNIALNELGNMVNDFIPSTLADKAIAIWKAGLLTSFRTHERNFVGNAIHGTMEVLKDLPATAADIALSGRTGQRTTTFTTKGLGEFGSKSTRQQMSDIVSKGFDPSQTIDKFDYKQITWGKNPIEQTLKKYTDIVFRSLGASDKPFYNASMARSLYDQAGAEAINAGRRGDMSFIENLVKNPTEQMVKTAINDANVATFKTKNAASEVANTIKRVLGKNELSKIAGEVTMPFTGVPSSILGQIQAYSPIGLVKGIYKVGDVAINKLPELQRQAVQELGRGVIGTGIFGLGAYLMGKGLITGQPKDATEARQWELENKPRNSIMINGKWRSLNSIGPESVVFLAGAKLKEEMSNPEGGLGQYAMSLGKDYLDQSFVQGLQGPINAITDPMRYGKSYLGQLASSPIPNIIKDTSRALDPNARETNTVLDYVKSGVPGLRNTLTEKRDALGNIIPQEPTGINAFIDLFNSKTPVDNLTVNELARLNNVGNNATPSKMSSSQTILGNKVKLTFEQLNRLEAGAGQSLKPQLEQLILSPTYQQLDDESKVKAIDKLVTNVRTLYKSTNATDIVSGITPSATYKAPATPKVKSTKLKVKKAKKPKKIKISAPKKIKVAKLKAMKIKKPKKLKLSFKKTKPVALKIPRLKFKQVA